MILGITGRTATGKSTLSGIFEKEGFVKIDADEIYSRLLENCEKMKSELLDEFKTLDRGKLYSLVSNDRDNLARLNAITHKYVADEIRGKVGGLSSRDIVLDVPVPIEKGFIDICDYIAVTDCSAQTQIKRLVERNSISGKEAVQRISMQDDREHYVRIGDYIVITDNTVKDDLAVIARDIKKHCE